MIDFWLLNIMSEMFRACSYRTFNRSPPSETFGVLLNMRNVPLHLQNTLWYLHVIQFFFKNCTFGKVNCTTGYFNYYFADSCLISNPFKYSYLFFLGHRILKIKLFGELLWIIVYILCILFSNFIFFLKSSDKYKSNQKINQQSIDWTLQPTNNW